MDIDVLNKFLGTGQVKGPEPPTGRSGAGKTMKYQIEVSIDEGIKEGTILGETWKVDTGNKDWRQRLRDANYADENTLVACIIGCIEDYEETDEAIDRKEAKLQGLMKRLDLTEYGLELLLEDLRSVL